MGRARTAGLAVLAIALAAVGGVLLWLRTDGGGAAATPATALRPANAGADAELALAAGVDAVAPAERVGLGPASAELAVAALDGGWRAALGGLSGRVVETDSTPVAGMSVELHELDLGTLTGSLAESFEGRTVFDRTLLGRARTDDEGRFRFGSMLPSGMHALLVDPRGARATLVWVDCGLVPGEVAELGDVVLAPSATIVGRVVDAAGAPVQGAVVRAMPDEEASALAAFLWADSAITLGGGDDPVELPNGLRSVFASVLPPAVACAADGSFRIERVPAGSIAVLAEAPGHDGTLSDDVECAAGAQVDAGEIRLPHMLPPLRGRVVWSDGRPVAGARIRAGIRRDGFLAFSVLRNCGLTDRSGAFAIGPMADGEEYLVDVLPPLGSRGHAERVPKDAVDALIELPAPVEAQVVLVDTSGRVVPEAELRIGSNGVDRLHWLIGLAHAPARAPRPVAPGRLALEEIMPGAYPIHGRTPDGRMAWATLKVEVGGEEVTLVFPAGPPIELAVTDAVSGRPIAAALVALLAEDDGQPTPGRARTDADGVVRLFPPVQDEGKALWARVDHPAWPVTYQRIERGAGLARIAIAPAASVHGRVVDAEQESRRLVVSLESGDSFPNRDELEAPRFAVVRSDRTFRFANLPAGKWDFRLRAREREVAGLMDPNGGDVIAKGTWELAPGERLDALVRVGAKPD